MTEPGVKISQTDIKFHQMVMEELDSITPDGTDKTPAPPDLVEKVLTDMPNDKLLDFDNRELPDISD